MKKCTLTLVAAGLLSASLLSAPVMAIPSDAMIDVYNQAAEGDKILVDVAHQSFEKHITEQGADPLSLVYLGSTQTLMGRDAWMPWNQMAHTEKGLATIAKGLDLLAIQQYSADRSTDTSRFTRVLSGEIYRRVYFYLPARSV